MFSQNYCGSCGKRLSHNDEFCPNCGAKTVFKDTGEDCVFIPPIHNIGFFDLDVDFSPYIESTRDDFKYEICACGYLNLKENDYCYHCGVKRTHSKLRRIFKPESKPTFSFTTVTCECGHINDKENLFCEMCVKKLLEEEGSPLKDLYSNFEFEFDYPIFCFCGQENDDSSQFCSNCGFPLDKFENTNGEIQKLCFCSTLNNITSDFCIDCGINLQSENKALICVCGTINPLSAKFCSSCDRELNPKRFVKSKLVCSCGKIMDYGVEFCPNCGKNIEKVINRKIILSNAGKSIRGIFR